MSKYGSVNAGFSGEKKALPAGTYGTGSEPGLKIVAALDSKETKEPGLWRYGWLVAATGAAEGTCFFHINLRNEWLEDGALALAFSTPELATGDGEMNEARDTLMVLAASKAAANGSPADKLEADTAAIYEKVLTQIRINVGTVFRLQDWAEKERDPHVDPQKLVGTEFSGTVEASSIAGSVTTEVKTVFSKKNGKTHAAPKQAEAKAGVITDDDIPF